MLPQPTPHVKHFAADVRSVRIRRIEAPCACGHCRRHLFVKDTDPEHEYGPEITVYDTGTHAEASAWLPPGWKALLLRDAQAERVTVEATNGAVVSLRHGLLTVKGPGPRRETLAVLVPRTFALVHDGRQMKRGAQ